jgi:Ca2+-binding EF-hand superfamily protein
MKTKLATLSIALCALMSASAFAADRPGHRGGLAMLDTDKSGTISQAEACAGPRGAEGLLCKNFAAIDANKDGQLSKDELKELGEALGARKARPKLDTDGNGSLSQAEACNGPKGADGAMCKNFAALDTNKDGALSKEELRAGKMAFVAHQGVKRLDTDGNGAISQAEACNGPRGAQGKVCLNFEAMDANKDGSLSRDEMRAYYAANHGKRRQ